jgi:hypothetical protein
MSLARWFSTLAVCGILASSAHSVTFGSVASASFSHSVLQTVATPAPIMTSFAGPSYGLDGTGLAATFSSIGDLAISSDGTFALVTDPDSFTIRRIDLETRLVTTLAGVAGEQGNTDGVGATARFMRPNAIEISADGGFALVADYDSSALFAGLRKIDLLTNRVSTIAIEVSSGFALAPDGKSLYVPFGNFITKKVINESPDSWNEYRNENYFFSRIVLSNDGSYAIVTGQTVDYKQAIFRFDIASKTLTVLAGANPPPIPDCYQSVKDGPGSTLGFCGYLYDLRLSPDERYVFFMELGLYLRRLDLTTNEVITLAGRNSWNGSNDGVGRIAAFNYAWPITVNPDGSYLLIGDLDNLNIRRVQLSATADAVANTVTTLAGQLPYGRISGTGSVARITSPQSIALSSDGSYAIVASNEVEDIPTNEYITLDGSIRRLQVTDGAVAAGTMTVLAAGFDNINGLALSSDGNFALALSGFDIRRVDFTTSPVSITVLAGGYLGFADGVGEEARFDNPYKIALSRDNSFALITDGNAAIRRIDLETRAVTTIAGQPDPACDGQATNPACSRDGVGTEARLRGIDVAISSDNRFAIVSDGIGLIRKIDLATNEVTTLAGNREQAGQVIVSDGVGAAASFRFPNGLALSSDDRYALVSDVESIRKIDIATGTVTSLVELYPFSSGYVAEDIVIDLSGSFALFVDEDNHKVFRIGDPPATEGKVTTLAGLAGQSGDADGDGQAARFRNPTGVAISDTGIGLVVDPLAHTVRQVVLSNGAVFTLAGSAGQAGSADGPGPEARFNTPTSAAIDPIATYGLVVDSGNHTLRKVDLRSGKVTTVAGQAGNPGSSDGTGSGAQFNQPLGVALSRDDSFALMTDSGNHTVRRVALSSGTVTTLAGSPGQRGSANGVGAAARFDRPGSISLSPDGRFALVFDEGNNAIRRIEVASGQVSTLRTNAVAQINQRVPAQVESGIINSVGLGCRNSEAVLASSETETVLLIDTTTGELRPLAGLTNTPGAADGFGEQARFRDPSSAAVSCYGGGTILIGDTGNKTLRPINLGLQNRLVLPMVWR